MSPLLLVRKPPTSLADGIVSHIEDKRDSIDYEKALSQWHAYTQVYKDRGWKVEVIDQENSLPDSVFVEDGVVFVGSPDQASSSGIYILTSPGNETREGEIQGIEAALKTSIQSTRPIARITKPGTLDGGDVLKVPSQHTIYIGNSQRTNAKGIQQFTSLVEPLGWQVKVVPVRKALHLSE
jgi:dimethylargininase